MTNKIITTLPRTSRCSFQLVSHIIMCSPSLLSWLFHVGYVPVFAAIRAEIYVALAILPSGCSNSLQVVISILAVLPGAVYPLLDSYSSIGVSVADWPPFPNEGVRQNRPVTLRLGLRLLLLRGQDRVRLPIQQVYFILSQLVKTNLPGNCITHGSLSIWGCTP